MFGCLPNVTCMQQSWVISLTHLHNYSLFISREELHHLNFGGILCEIFIQRSYDDQGLMHCVEWSVAYSFLNILEFLVCNQSIRICGTQCQHPRRLDPTMELIKYSLVLHLQHGRHDVKCKPSIRRDARYVNITCKNATACQ